MSNEKDLVWLPKELANRVNQITDADALNKEIEGYVDSVKKELKINTECIDEDILVFRAAMVKARDSFREAKQAELDSMYEIWESFDKDISVVKTQIKQAVDAVEPLKKEFKDLRAELDIINRTRYELEELIKVLQSFDRCTDTVKSLFKKAISDE